VRRIAAGFSEALAKWAKEETIKEALFFTSKQISFWFRG
jgi:hypothetical protein